MAKRKPIRGKVVVMHTEAPLPLRYRSGRPARPQERFARIYDRTTTDVPKHASALPSLIADPLEKGAGLKVTRNVRHDILARLMGNGFIAPHQYEAGRKFENFCGWAEIGGARAIDLTKPKVDGGRLGVVWDFDRRSYALGSLKQARVKLGQDGYNLCFWLLGENRTLRELSVSEWHERLLGRHFRDCLETLAILWGLATKRRR